jgi:hypothetical protein
MSKNGLTSATDAVPSGRPTKTTSAQNGERARELIPLNRRVAMDEIAKQLNISIGSAYSVVHVNLHFHKVCVWLVSKNLMDELKRMRLDICSRHWLVIAKKLTVFCNGSSQAMKPVFTTANQRPSEEHAREASVLCCKEIQDATFLRQVDFNHLLGFSRAYS